MASVLVIAKLDHRNVRRDIFLGLCEHVGGGDPYSLGGGLGSKTAASPVLHSVEGLLLDIIIDMLEDYIPGCPPTRVGVVAPPTRKTK